MKNSDNFASGNPLWRLYFDRKNEIEIQVQTAGNHPVISQNDNRIEFSYKGATRHGKTPWQIIRKAAVK